MKITNITKQKEKLLIEIDNSIRLKVLESVKDDFNLYVNKEIEQSLINKIKKENKIEELFLIASKKVAVKDYSPFKMREFLLKKCSKKDYVESVIKRLTKYNLINEDEFIQNIVSFCNSKHYGFNRIISMLYQRGISKTKIDQIEYDEKREKTEAEIQTNILKRRNKNKNTTNQRKTVYNSLIRYGFNDEIASFFVSTLINSPKDELNMLKLEYSHLVSSFSRKVNENDLKQTITKKLLSKGYKLNDIKYVMEEDKNEMD